MKKLNRRSTLYGCVLIVILTLLTLGSIVRRQGTHEQERHVAVDYLRRISDLDYQLKQRVLEAHSFMHVNYDSLVEVTTLMQAVCPKMETLSDVFLFSLNDKTETLIREYCALSRSTLEDVEEFKSWNSLLRNSVRYLPSLVDSFSNQNNRDNAAAIYNQVLNFCIEPTRDLSDDLRGKLTHLNKVEIQNGTDRLQMLTLQKHAAVIIQAVNERQRLEAKIDSQNLRRIISQIADSYIMATDRLEAQSKYLKAAIISFASLLLVLLLSLLYRLQITAESISELNQGLEKKVNVRTKELTTALKELETQQQFLAHATKMSALGEMAGGIAHEINTPLAAISLKAESIIMIEENSPGTIKGLEEIIAIVQRLAKIVTGLRRFSRDDHNEPMAPTTLKVIVEQTLELCGQKFRSQGIELRLSLNEKLIIQCIPEQISQVLLNLLNNSYDAIFDRSEKWISIEIFDGGANAGIRVVDSGKGIPLGVREKMMQPFYTTKAVGKGTGIGLSISRAIIERHSGQLTYDATSANTAFEISLPMLKVA